MVRAVSRAQTRRLLCLWLTAWLSASQHTQAQAPRARERSVLEAPKTLVLGTDSTAKLRYRARPELQAKLFTNIGSIGPAKQSPDGFWEAEYFPPSTRYPQIAIIALVSRNGGQVTWTRIALHGTATVELRSDPHVQVRARVGSAEFGPVTTDAAGRAALAVVVPPGSDHAVSSATDALGNVRNQDIPLHVPVITPLLSVCPVDDASDFLVFAARPDGTAAGATPLAAQASIVEVTGISEPESGVYRVGFTIPQGVRAGELAHFSVALQGKNVAAVGCDLALPLERPDHIDVQLDRTRHTANQTEPVHVRIVPKYRGSREPAPITLTLTAGLGELSQGEVNARDATELTWTLPHDFGGRTRASMHVAGDHEQELTIELVAGEPHQLTLTADQDHIQPDGISGTTLHLVARDAYGNPTRVSKLSSRAQGSLSEWHMSAPGHYDASYRAPLATGGKDMVLVHEAKHKLQATRTLYWLDAGGHITVGARVGYLTNFARVAGPLFVAQAGYRLPLLQRRLRISAAAGYYQSDMSVPSNVERIDVNVQGIPLLLRVEYSFLWGRFEFAPMLGGGTLIAASKLSSASTGTSREHAVVPLWAAGAIAAMFLGPGRVVLELAYESARLNGNAVSGNAAGANITLGYDFIL